MMIFARLCIATLLAFSLGSAPARAEDGGEIMPQTLPVPLSAADGEAEKVGELIWRGGLKVEPGEAGIGGISGLEWVDDEADYGGGALWAVSDDGRWLKIVPTERGGVLSDLYSIHTGPLRDLRGKELRRKEEADAEAITRAADGGWLVSFERDHRIWRYADLAGEAVAVAPPALTPAEANSGFETLAAYPDGVLACVEAALAAIPNCERLPSGETFTLTAPPALLEHGGAPTDAACAQDGICYILTRSYRPGYGNRAAIIELATDNTQKTLAVLDVPLTRDNFEGLALREQYGKRYLYLASDDNFNNCYVSEREGCQHTLVMKFEIMRAEDAAPLPVANAPEPDPQYETTPVVLETTLGAITVALETERAPITSANFLRYVDAGRLDGTVFYRAMSLKGEPQPNGLIQGGAQNDPRRLFPPIAHEPTSATGLSHTHGALSMAMGEPGTATADFSIMLQDQTGLDADPAATDPVWRNGYAVFGYVIAGMDVVAAIHGGRIDPDKGEGWMIGQMLAEPVKILKARRAD